MHGFALGMLWLPGAAAEQERAAAWAGLIPRVYVIDARPQGAPFASIADPRLHYAPLRQKTRLGTALNRALALAAEEGQDWLWIFDTTTVLKREDLEAWSQKASPSVGLYHSSGNPWPTALWQRMPLGFLVSVKAARQVGGWNTHLPSALVLPDFHERLAAAGWSIERGPPLQRQGHLGRVDPVDIAHSLLLMAQKRS